jgi:2,3-bisphosphoglycerate-independent phosphoglycerate mutase
MKYLAALLALLPLSAFAGDGAVMRADFGLSALLISAAFGLFSAYSGYQSQQAEIEAAKAQSELDQQAARMEAEEDAKAEQDRVASMRDEQKRRRAAIEAAYAGSGVVLEGSAADILTRQREADELNVQKEHAGGNRRRELMKWGSGQQAKLDKFANRQRSRAAGMQLVSGIGATGMNAYTMTQQDNFTKSWF